MRNFVSGLFVLFALTVGGLPAASASEFASSRNTTGEGVWLRKGKLTCSTDEGRAAAFFDSTTHELSFKCGNSVEKRFELGENERQLVYNESVEGGTSVTVVVVPKPTNR